MKLPRIFAGLLLAGLVWGGTGVEAQSDGRSAGPAVPANPPGIANPAAPAGKHRGKVNAIIYDGANRILSAGEDGFLGIWNIADNAAEERFQLSSYALMSMVLRPGYPQIALVESDGMGRYRISAWDYQKKKNLFILRFRDPISCLAYSAGGNFIILSGSAQSTVVFIHAETGEPLESPAGLTGPVSFAATGRSERTMISYSPSGVLSYWELESGEERLRLSVPAAIASPILFRNNTLFGGFDAQGLVILDAGSGNEILRDRQIKRGALFPANTGGAEFLCLSVLGDSIELYQYGISTAGRLEILNRTQIACPQDSLIPGDMIFVPIAAEIALGTSGGGVYLLSPDGTARPMAASDQIPVREAAASGSVLAFIMEGDVTAFIPADYTALRSGSPLHLASAESYTHIASAPGNGRSGLPGTFLFWQDIAPIPVIKTVERGSSPLQFRESGRIRLDTFSLPFPIRSVSVLDNHALFLDSAGNLAVFSMGPVDSPEPTGPAETGTMRFSFSSAGALDAAFLDGQNIIIARSAVSGNTPFLKININTGETVPLAYPVSIGVRIYRGGSGALYGTAIDGSGDEMKTVIVRLDPSNPAQSVRIAEYQGEDTAFGIAENAGVLAAAIGGDGAARYGEDSFTPFERSPGLPVALINGGGRFIVIDEEGSIVWHDGETGKLLALLRIYQNEWILKTKDGTSLRGPTIAAAP
ncbi:hypothetical protein AGMMS50267_01660 [Spirochaetia bacterium]|nr:hypothetical protein AGMMS50267_01660 [Spirochaetia bacterium]